MPLISPNTRLRIKVIQELYVYNLPFPPAKLSAFCLTFHHPETWSLIHQLICVSLQILPVRLLLTNAEIANIIALILSKCFIDINSFPSVESYIK